VFHTPVVSPARLSGHALSDYDGEVHQFSAYRGRKVLLSFFCGCSLCSAAAREWQRQFTAERGLQMLAVSDFSPTIAATFRAKTGMGYPLLTDCFGSVAERYESTSCPRCWLINADGRVLYTSHVPWPKLDAISGRIREMIKQ
jgi:peroxiredoxin